MFHIEERIKKAATKVKRDPGEIVLLAVSKNQPIEKIDFFYRKGLQYFGENRVQELREKYRQRPDIGWHFIGHLQRNKVKYLLRMDNCVLIHSLDSWSLAEEINRRAARHNRVMPVLLEVNVAGERNKQGIRVEEVEDFLAEARNLNNMEIRGLMTMAPYVETPEEVRPVFNKLAAIRKEMKEKGFNLRELSMGMSNDFEVAIEEGATIVRIGTSLFGLREVEEIQREV
ncbi:MAG TPA: YggS family pyridoxal phosphate-dependent enzyme [Halanaerobiales bacterium]|nr:YggS family pyridoxal phosphate-dependent enzyme [Bacillota bacterium]HOA40743.1 YggS family pyridoxal phosphate-dependent enzyme [Halanaerobiales bacterium]HPZ62245.1 YggS family pyridoxal phosphate-dependent enzyme [Halanaerobiales bacterium]